MMTSRIILAMRRQKAYNAAAATAEVVPRPLLFDAARRVAREPARLVYARNAFAARR